MNAVLIALFVISTCWAVFTGHIPESGAAVLEGAEEAVRLCINISGAICLWSAAMELMERCGLSERLASALQPLLGRLFPESCRSKDARQALSENVSANLLGLGSAATPSGLRAARAMAACCPQELGLLVVMNTASLQLLPTTIASLRAGMGAASPFDILPAVWLSSLASQAAGLGLAALLRRCSR